MFHQFVMWVLNTSDLLTTFSFIRLQGSSTSFVPFVGTHRTWRPSASTPSTPSWIPGFSSSAASLCSAIFALCWAAASAKAQWRRRHTPLYLYPLTYSATLQRLEFHRPTCTPIYLCDPTGSLESGRLLASDWTNLNVSYRIPLVAVSKKTKYLSQWKSFPPFKITLERMIALTAKLLLMETFPKS